MIYSDRGDTVLAYSKLEILPEAHGLQLGELIPQTLDFRGQPENLTDVQGYTKQEKGQGSAGIS